MAIFLNDDIECRKAEPLDTRVRVANQSGLTSLNTLYNYAGMLVVTLDTLGVYQLKASVSGSTITDWELKSFITPTQASDIVTNNAKVSFDSTSSTRLANTSGTNTGDQTASSLGAVTITGNQSIGGDKTFTGSTVAASLASFRPVGTQITGSTNLENVTANTFYDLNAAGGAIVITVTDQANTDFPIGSEWEFSPVELSNDISFVAGGSTAIDSVDGYLKLDKAFSGAILKKTANNSFRLIGTLKL